jgi:2-polyprenyl-3-methyl-5-hydroxy-6-metoxy-1,4-benzoquinol methylase
LTPASDSATEAQQEAVRVSDKVNSVRELFRRTDWYVNGWRTTIAIRTEIVHDFVGRQAPHSILDIGCGDGSVTIPLLTPANRLTLLDLSDKMLAIARTKVPANLLDRVKFVNENVIEAPLTPQSFDLIVCVGVLAHVDSPEALISRICELLTPGGTIVVECSDAQHFLTKLSSIRARIVRMLKPPSYVTNKISSAWVIDRFQKSNFVLTGSYRHTFSIPLISRFITPDQSHAAIRTVFGDGGRNKNSWLGNQCIFSFRRN